MESATPTVDPILFEILSHRLHQITREMGVTLERVGGTVNTTQMKDYMSALYRANGDLLSAGASLVWHVPCAGQAVRRIIERFEQQGGIAPDDMFLLNDPYVAAIHQSDVYIISPMHVAEQLVGWSASFVHVMDIGAHSPGGNSPEATEICHEGVRIPGIKLIDRGVLRQDVFDAITTMTRQPVMVGLDLKCQIAANNVARARMQEMYAQYGPQLMGAVAAEMIRYTEAVLRQRIAQIPDGVWRASGVIESGQSWTVHLELTKEADRLRFDFTGTDAQARVGINLPIHATFGACYNAIVETLAYDLPRNHGSLVPIEVIAPPGTVVSAQYPAPVSLNTTSAGSVARYLAKSLVMEMCAASEQWRSEVTAPHLLGRFARHAGVNQHGLYYVSTLNGLDGRGARFQADGADSAGTILSHNTEWVESNFPVLQVFRRHVKDGAGAGHNRGGAAEETALALHDAPRGEIDVVALGVAGLRNAGQGLFGGYPGAPSILMHVAGTRLGEFLERNELPMDVEALGGEPRLLPYCNFELRQDDVLFIRCGSGGGYGDPLERDPALVLRDVANQVVSPELAREVYGVVIGGEQVDAAATAVARQLLREKRRAARGAQPEGAASIGVQDRMPRRVRVAPGTSTVTQPLRENLRVSGDAGVAVIVCARCQYALCPSGEDWRQACIRRLLDPTEAGPLFVHLQGRFRLEQLYCPSCVVLLNTDVVREAAVTVSER